MTRNYNWIWKGNVPSSTTFKTAPGSSSQALAMQNQPAYACISKENHWLRSFLGHRYMAGGSTFQTRTRKPSGMPYLPSQKSLEKWVRPKKWVVAMDPLNTQKDTSLSLSLPLSPSPSGYGFYIYIYCFVLNHPILPCPHVFGGFWMFLVRFTMEAAVKR